MNVYFLDIVSLKVRLGAGADSALRPSDSVVFGGCAGCDAACVCMGAAPYGSTGARAAYASTGAPGTAPYDRTGARAG